MTARPSIPQLWYMFGTLPRCWRSLEPDFAAGDYALSGRMLDCWTNFALCGDPACGRSVPSWKPYTASDPQVMEFNETLPGPLDARERLPLSELLAELDVAALTE